MESQNPPRSSTGRSLPPLTSPKTKTTTKTDTVKYEEKNKDKIQDKDIRVVIIDVAKNTAAVVHGNILLLSNIITETTTKTNTVKYEKRT